MVPLFTARAVSPSHIPVALPRTSIGLRNIWPLTPGRQAWYPATSRAFGTWTRNDVKSYHRPIAAKTPAYTRRDNRNAGLFSTSTTRRLKIEDDAKESQASRNHAEVGSTLTIDKILQISRIQSCIHQRQTRPLFFSLIQVLSSPTFCIVSCRIRMPLYFRSVRFVRSPLSNCIFNHTSNALNS